jgi:hypothetical protein
MSVPSGTKCRTWSAARSTPKAKSCPGNPAGVQSAVAQARLLFVAVDARRRQGFLPCRDPSHVSNPTSSELSSQKQLQAAPPTQPVETAYQRYLRPAPSGGRPNSNSRHCGAVEDARTERLNGPARITGTAGCCRDAPRPTWTSLRTGQRGACATAVHARHHRGL